ncbi:MAG TPA: radical SAM protein, partial [Polyangiaceae bacterium]|nr:radical SAM protein [Polyangiaceae bacterium]
MLVARVLTNETCNQNCGFCDARRPAESPSVARGEAVLRRIDEAARGGAREIVLTGGEPSLRRDLPLLIKRAKGAEG